MNEWMRRLVDGIYCCPVNTSTHIFVNLELFSWCDKWREPNGLPKCKVRIVTKWKHDRRPGKLVVVTSLPPRHFLSVDPLWYLPFYFHTTCHSVWKWILLTGFSLSLHVAYIQHHNKQISTSETNELFSYIITVWWEGLGYEMIWQVIYSLWLNITECVEYAA